MRKIAKILATALALVAMMGLSGCNIISLNDFKFEGAKVVDFDLSKGARVEMTITNNSAFKVTIVGGELGAHYKGAPIGDIYMKNSVVLPRKSTTTVTLDVGLKFASPMAALTALGALTKSPGDITVTGYGEGKVWFVTKRFERRDVPLSKFIDIFGEPSQYL